MPIVPGPTGSGSTIIIEGDDGNRLHILDVGPADEGDYDCVLSNTCGSVTSSAATLTVTDCCPGDLDADGAVDLQDLATVLANFGTPSGAKYSDGDLDGDGDVDLQDLASLLSVCGLQC